MTSGLIPFYQGQDDASISNGSVVCQSPHSVRHTLSHRRFKRIVRVVIFTIAMAHLQIASLTILDHDR